MRLTPTLFAFAALVATSPARAESDFERGYREGYGRGYQDAQSGRHGYSKSPSSPSSGWRNSRGIVVVRAWYGDHRNSCDLTSWAAGRFNNRTSAEANVSNDLCGDPAPGKRKSLEVEYYCQGEMKTTSAYEHRKLSISCH